MGKEGCSVEGRGGGFKFYCERNFLLKGEKSMIFVEVYSCLAKGTLPLLRSWVSCSARRCEGRERNCGPFA